MGLLLKQLDIHGFKSFATPTTFVFDRGITAIIGPNGSGKSNVAEALRWVLGEQGHANLRSRRTEDVIFAGSDKRSQQSLAEVTLTLDNSDGSLPLAFSEVTVSRRAFRTGENQYLVNGGRVRLKDVQQLVAPLGQAYTIIGQGLVDAALSQRPEERRGLFEHAAGISGLRLRANDAERGLAETGANAQRLRDIAGELEPRVRSLERSARLAREYEAVRDRLRAAQRAQYAQQWAAHLERVQAAQSTLSLAETACQAMTAERVAIAGRLSALRGNQQRLGSQLTAHEELLREHEQELVRARHQQELHGARDRSNADRLSDLQSARRQLDRERSEALSSIEMHRAALMELSQRIDSMQQALLEREALVAEATLRRRGVQQELARDEQAVVDLTRRVAELEGQLSSFADRRAHLQHEHDQLLETSRDSVAQRVELVSRIASRAAESDAGTAKGSRLSTTIAETQHRTDEAQQAAKDVAVEIDRAEREEASLRSRLESLQRTHMNGEGLYAGVKAILRAVNRKSLDLPGFVGVLAESIEVPGQFETAIEVALGGHLQDIVVRRWSDAQAAISYLKQEGAGRATFQPLDTLQRPHERRLDLSDDGLLGLASNLVSCDEDVRIVVDQLLGRTLVATDLHASRRLVAHGGGWTIVTQSGEITRPAGSVTGGARSAEAGMLARERERRTLPTAIATAVAHLSALRDEYQQHTRRLEALRAELQATSARLIEVQRLTAVARGDLDQAQRELSMHDAVARSNRSRAVDVAGRIDSTAAAESVAQEALSQAKSALDSHIAAAETLRAALSSLSYEAGSQEANLRAELAGARERAKATETMTTQLELRVRELDESIDLRAGEIERLTATATEISSERDLMARAIGELEEALAGQRAALPPLRTQLASAIASIRAVEQEHDRSIGGLRDGERDRDLASLQVARAQDEGVFLVERIRNDLDLDDPSELERELPTRADFPNEQEIARLRERLRRMAVVGPDVVEQFESESERLSFLSRQLQDVDDATLGLRKVLDELNEQMAARFITTFRDVAAAFELTFSRLFGGGSARLMFSEDDSGTSGIDIIAQPPGKRLQHLNALSGGERALAAVALLIAIQRVNPSPFCLLDEVDAALDESNVLRFRDEIRDLARTTQFVLITHNRGTIEGADTLYGVTMGDDGISRVISLRLDEAVTAVDDLDIVGVS